MMVRAQGTLQVALMFLVVDKIPVEPIWTAFIAAAGELTLRSRVPPTQPSPPSLITPIEPDQANLDADCWQHGWSVPLNLHPSQPYRGARAARRRRLLLLLCPHGHAVPTRLCCACLMAPDHPG